MTKQKENPDMSNKKNMLGSIMTKYGLAFFAVLIVIVFTLLEPRFASLKNFMNILTAASIMAISSIGITIIMSSGEIDFACGMELTIAGVVLGVIMDSPTFHNYFLGVAIVILLVIVVGIFNSFLHVKIGIPAFIATMGTSLVLQGAAMGLTGGSSMYSGNWPMIFKFLGQSYLFNVIPMPVVILIVVSVTMWIYAELTNNGKTMYAVGSNPNACKYVGIDIRKQKYKGFIICAILCGIGGIIQSSMLNRVDPYMGDNTLVNSLTALMLGATFLRPGVFNIPGTLLGTLIVTIFSNGFTMISAPQFIRDLIIGLVMAVAVSLVTVIRRRTEKIE